MKTLTKIFLLMSFSLTISAAENCTPANKKAVCDPEKVKKVVDDMCTTIENEGEAALTKVKSFRYDCCGEPNYIWINDLHPTMIIHPIKPQLDKTDLSNSVDPDGKKLFVEFVKAVKKTPKGDWVDYKWTKMGESDPTAKTSWVQLCKPSKQGEGWVVGSGTWK